MNLQRTLDPLMLVIRTQALGKYMGINRWLLVYVYMYR
jgi:hypothetical protein